MIIFIADLDSRIPKAELENILRVHYRFLFLPTEAPPFDFEYVVSGRDYLNPTAFVSKRELEGDYRMVYDMTEILRRCVRNLCVIHAPDQLIIK